MSPLIFFFVSKKTGHMERPSPNLTTLTTFSLHLLLHIISRLHSNISNPTSNTTKIITVGLLDALFHSFSKNKGKVENVATFSDWIDITGLPPVTNLLRVVLVRSQQFNIFSCLLDRLLTQRICQLTSVLMMTLNDEQNMRK